MKLLIDNGQGYVDYTRYVLDGSLSVEDSVNVPVLTSFQLAASDNSFVVPKRSAYFQVLSEIFAEGGGYIRASQSVGAINYNVPGTSEPWNSTDPTYPFFDGGLFNPGTGPVSIPVQAGKTYAFVYQSGTVFLHGGSQGPYTPDGSYPALQGGTQAPGATYFPESNYTACLVGGYSDAAGHLVAPPFFIGNNAIIGPIPTNCTKILVGINDFPWGDNTGTWVVQVGIWNANRRLATGFITNEPERVYLGLNAHLPKFNQEQYQYNINGTSDEWILNTRTVPYIPAFVNQTDSEILASLANALAPDFFDTAQMATGTIVPYFQYDPSQTWSDIAKTFADANRYHYKVVDRKILYQPFGDQALGIAFDDQTMRKSKLFPSELHTGVLTVPPVNDCIVIGDIEPQANWENYFIGDGFTSNFQLRHQVFQGTSSNLLNDDWTESSFQQGMWVANDPQGVLFLADGNGNAIGALNVAQQGVSGAQYLPQFNATYVQAQNGVELGGGINLQHGQFTFNDHCNGIVGSLFGSSSFVPGNVLAGFSCTGQSAAGPFTVATVQHDINTNLVTVTINGAVTTVQPGNVLAAAGFGGASFLNGNSFAIQSMSFAGGVTTMVIQGLTRYLVSYGPAADGGTLTAASNAVLITASGAAGVVIQPVYLGQNVGPRIVSQINHQYVLQTWVGATAQTRYTRPYTNLTQSATYGNQNLAAAGTISFIVTDVNLGNFVSEQQNPLFGLFPAAPPPSVTKYTVENTALPPFALYCLLNAINLNLSVNYTNLSLPPQGFLTVQSLTGASGGNNPWLPSQLSVPIPYQLGFGMINQTAQIGQQGEAFTLSFYTDDIPSVGARIRFQSWAAGQSVARVVDNVAIANEFAITGDSGVRSAIMQNMSPLPRTSDECEAAAAAAIRDREYPQFQGTYTFVTKPYNGENIMAPSLYQYPQTGRFLWINSPVRAITGQNFFANTVRVQVIELRDEVLNVSIDYGPDLYLENLLPSFLEREQNLLVPKQTAQPPNPVTLPEVLIAHLQTLDRAQVSSVVNSLTGNYITVDLGAAPVTGCEVRNVDGGWGVADQGLVGFFTSQTFTLPRSIRDQTWYLRTKNGSVYSRFSKALRVVYPLIPSPPSLISANSNSAVFDYAGDVRDIYGLEVKADPLSGIFFVQFPNAPEDTIYQFARNSILVPTDPAAGGLPVRINSNVGLIYNPPSNASTFPFPEQFGLGDIVFSSCPTDSSFGNVKVISNLFAASGSSGGTSVSNKITCQNLHGWLLPYVGAKGTYAHPTPLGSGISVPYAQITPYSLVFNRAYNRQYPMLNRKFDAAGHSLGDFVLNATMTQNYDMAITGQLVVPAAGFYSLNISHDDGFLYAIQGATQISGPNFNMSLMTATTVLGLPTSGGYNHSGNRSTFETGPGPDVCVVSFPSAGTYNFEVDYSNWESAETLQVTANGYDILPASFLPSASGSPWGVGWFDYRQPYPDTIGQAIQYGLDNQVGTLQLYYRPPVYSIAASGSISGGYSGLCTIYTQANHGLNPGDQVCIGVGWQTFPQSGYPRLPNTGAVFCGLQTVTAVPSAKSFQFVSTILSDVANIVPASWEDTVSNLGVTPQYLNGVISIMPTPFNLAASSGIIVQRPIFAPSDLIVDFTNADIAEELGILQLLSPNGRVGGLQARFYNLTWDYSSPTIIPSFQVPTITGIFIDPVSQAVSWNVATGRPTGYRVVVSDPTSGQVYNRFTVDNPQNPQLLKQFQMSPTDFASPRLVTVTPFDVTGDGVPQTVFHAGSSTGGGGTTAVFSECIDVRSFGAVGDGTTDDTTAIQNALSQAQSNANGSFPAPSECVVCIPSSLNCLVTPQFLDGTTSASGFGPTAGCLKIGSGVTLKIEGQLSVGSNGNYLAYPWVAIENYSAYPIFASTNDQNITIEGAGSINCNSTLLAHNVGAVKFQGVSGSLIRDIGLVDQNLYGIYCVNAYDTSIDHLQILPTSSQAGFVVILDKCLNSHVIGGSIDGSYSTARQMSYVADYGSVGTLVDGNSLFALEGTLVSRFNYGYDDKRVGQQYSGLRVTNNVFVSGSASGSFVVTCVASGTLDYGIAIDGNTILGCLQGGIQLGNLADALITNNTIEGNSQGIVRASGTTLLTTSIFNNVVKGNVIDFPVATLATSPIYNDGTSTATMYNPAIDRILYSSFVYQQPTIEGVQGGVGGLVYPPDPPNSFYSVSASGNASGTVVQQSGTSSSIVVNPFTIVWPDKTVTYGPPSGGLLTTTHGLTTYHVFVDDPYRDGNSATIRYGTTVQIRDLTSAAGRYYLGTVIMTAAGSVAGSVGGMIPPGTITITSVSSSTGSSTASGSNLYDIGCTIMGLVPPSGYILVVPFVRAIVYASGWGPSLAWCHITASGTVVLTINKITAGVGSLAQVGTITYTSGQPFATLAGGGLTYNIRDVMVVIGPTSLDSTLADIGFVLSGTRA